MSFLLLIDIQNGNVGIQCRGLFPTSALRPGFAYLDFHAFASIFMYLEMTFAISAFITSIISGEQFTRSDISRISKRSFAISLELFLLKKNLIHPASFILCEKYRLPLSRKKCSSSNRERELPFRELCGRYSGKPYRRECRCPPAVRPGWWK